MSRDRAAASSLVPSRLLLAIASVVDIALHARPAPVSAKLLAARHGLPPRHLETVLQALVHSGVLKGVRGPRGGYELARERRRISAGEVARAALSAASAPEADAPSSTLVEAVIEPLVATAGAAFLAALDTVSIDDLCRQAEDAAVFGRREGPADFAI